MEKSCFFVENGNRTEHWKEVEIIKTENAFLKTNMIHSKKWKEDVFLFQTCDYIFFAFLVKSTDRQDRFFIEKMEQMFPSDEYLMHRDYPFLQFGFHSYAEAREFWVEHEKNILVLAEQAMQV